MGRHVPRLGIRHCGAKPETASMTKQAIDFTSPTWHAIQGLASSKLQELREQNDSQMLDAIATANKRGRIAAWKELLALADPKPTPEQQPPGY